MQQAAFNSLYPLPLQTPYYWLSKKPFLRPYREIFVMPSQKAHSKRAEKEMTKVSHCIYLKYFGKWTNPNKLPKIETCKINEKNNRNLSQLLLIRKLNHRWYYLVQLRDPLLMSSTMKCPYSRSDFEQVLVNRVS